MFEIAYYSQNYVSMLVEFEIPYLQDKPLNYVESFFLSSGRTPETSSNHSSSNYRKILDEEISCLVGLQIRSTFYRIEGGLMVVEEMLGIRK